MSKFKKIAAVLLSAVMLVCCLAVQASAESIFDTAKSINSGIKYTKELKQSEKGDFKISVSKSGTLVLKVSANLERISVTVLDSDGARLGPQKVDVTSGGSSIYQDEYYWDNLTEIVADTFTFDVDKGNYYIRIGNLAKNSKGKINLTATFPSSSSSSSSSKISCITIPMWVGDTMQLSTNAGSSGITWSSSKSSVATVSSSGKVTAKKSGTAVITAKSGNSTAKIQIKVTK